MEKGNTVHAPLTSSLDRNGCPHVFRILLVYAMLQFAAEQKTRYVRNENVLEIHFFCRSGIGKMPRFITSASTYRRYF